MKKFISYLFLCVGLVFNSCAKDESLNQGEGVVNFRIAVSSATQETRAYSPLDKLLIRIYTAEGGLIRRYTTMASMPENLYLVAGEYKVVVDAGDKSAATWTNKSYHGEKTFTVKANEAITEQVLCPTTNVGAMVTFGESIPAKFDGGAHVYVSANNEFKLSEISDVPTLKYEYDAASATGYFLLPTGTTNLSWGFYGESTELGSIATTGVIENVEAAMIYKLKFQYSKTPDGAAKITVLVDKSAEEWFDNIIFSPQPTLKGDGFPISKTIGFNNANVRLLVASVKKLSKVTMTANGTAYPVFDLASPPAPQAGISYETIDANNIRVILSPEFFAPFATGLHSLDFVMLDTDAGEGKGTAKFAMPGLIELTSSDYDLWNNSANFKAIVTDPAATDVKIAYRTSEGQWVEVAATGDDNHIYTAKALPSWTIETNAGGKTVYTPTPSIGIFANKSYEYKLVVGGTDKDASKTFSTSVDMKIPYGDMEDGGLSCFSTSNSSSSAWGSGNNTFSKSLCTQSSYTGMQGSHCAKLTAAAPVGMLAAGNLFTGTFSFDLLSTSGTVGFGQSYDWKARPTGLRIKYYAEKIGTVDIAKFSGSPLQNGDQDKARVFVAIVDWNSRHNVTSGGSAPTGIWDPALLTSTNEGKIIAYGSKFITESSTGGTMIDEVLPLYFYEKNIKPTGTYSLVISCSSSAYGDYMVGCQSNVVYIDDFRWEY